MNDLKSITYDEINNKIDYLIKYCEDSGIRISPNSHFIKSIISARNEIDAWNRQDFSFMNSPDFKDTRNDLIEISRLSFSAEILVKNNIDIKNHLVKIVKSPFDVKSPSPSMAKDFAFELTIASHLAEASLRPILKEPDVEFRLEDRIITVACKKIYSIRNMEKQVSRAREQIKKRGHPGIIALCLDALFDHIGIQEVSGKNEMVDTLIIFLKEFFDLHHNSFEKKLKTDSIIAVMLSVSTMANLRQELLPTTAMQSMAIPFNSEDLVKRFVDKFN